MSEPIPLTSDDRGESGDEAAPEAQEEATRRDNTPDEATASDRPAAAGPEEASAPDPEQRNTPAPADAPAPEPEIREQELRDQLLRALAEVENVRRRAERDRADAVRYSIAGFARDTLGVADNLRRTLDAARGAEGAERLAALIEGVEMTARELQAILGRHGIREVAPLGERFDHNFHQALFQVPDSEREPGTVTQVVQIGYVIGDRLLRPAMVGVARAPDPAPPEATPPVAERTPEDGGEPENDSAPDSGSDPAGAAGSA